MNTLVQVGGAGVGGKVVILISGSAQNVSLVQVPSRPSPSSSRSTSDSPIARYIITQHHAAYCYPTFLAYPTRDFAYLPTPPFTLIRLPFPTYDFFPFSIFPKFPNPIFLDFQTFALTLLLPRFDTQLLLTSRFLSLRDFS